MSELCYKPNGYTRHGSFLRCVTCAVSFLWYILLKKFWIIVHSESRVFFLKTTPTLDASLRQTLETLTKRLESLEATMQKTHKAQPISYLSQERGGYSDRRGPPSGSLLQLWRIWSYMS